MLKPIDTVYNGYRFRSRLEARVAVFFDALGIAYEYEKEGFELPGAGRYLPDFWLPNSDCWVEVKAGTPSREEDAKADRLCAYSERDVHFLTGDNFMDCWGITSRFIAWKEDDEETRAIWREEGSPHADTAGWPAPGYAPPAEVFCCSAVQIMAASQIARSARFEHGETPKVRATP